MSWTDDATERSPARANISAGTVLESIPDAVIVADFDTGRVVDANTAAGELFECEPQTLVGLDHTQLHPPNNIEEYYEAFRRGFEGEQVERLRDGSPLYIETLTGQRKPVEINARPLDEDGQSLVLGVFRDVTDRLERERQLKRTTSRLETLLDAAPLPVAVLDTDGTVDLWNRAAEETFGYAAEEAIGEPYPLFVDDDEFTEVFERILDGGILDGYETIHRTNGGARKTVELYARPLYADGAVTGAIGAAIDVTSQKRREQQLEILHRVLRHNLRNKLTVIRGHAEAIDAGDRVGVSESHDPAGRILAASDALIELGEQATQLRKTVTERQYRPEPVGLDALVATLTERLEAAVPVVSVSEPSAGDAVAVPGQIEQALGQLVRQVGDHVSDRTAPGIELRTAIQDRHVVVELHGEDPLLSGADQSLIKNGHETALQHGTGLTIARAYLVVTSVGGGFSLVDEAPDGYTLRIELPQAGVTDRN